MTRILPLLAVLVLAVAGGAWYLGQPGNPGQPGQSTGLVSSAFAQEADAQADAGGDAAAADPAEMILPDIVLGDADAPVTFIEYASYTCPHCAHFHGDQFKKLKVEYIDTGKVNFIHREVYFDRFGLWGGLLAHCGGNLRYYGIADMLYDQQKDWIGSGEQDEILDNLRTLGKTAGLTEDDINACFGDQEMAARLVATFQANAEADGVNATPTLVIDGEKYSNMPYDDLKAIIDAKLEDSKS